MAGRILFEIFFFSIPFVVFGLYLAATADAEQEGRRKWPINILFLCGIALATLAWVGLILMNDGDPDVCRRPSQFVDGKIVPGEEYPCEHDLSRQGKPGSDDPGGSAEGAESESGPVDDPS